MTHEEKKAELLALIRDDPDFRAAILAHVDPVRLTAALGEAPAPTPPYIPPGPGWLVQTAAEKEEARRRGTDLVFGPHTRLAGPKA